MVEISTELTMEIYLRFGVSLNLGKMANNPEDLFVLLWQSTRKSHFYIRLLQTVLLLPLNKIAPVASVKKCVCFPGLCLSERGLQNKVQYTKLTYRIEMKPFLNVLYMPH